MKIYIEVIAFMMFLYTIFLYIRYRKFNKTIEKQKNIKKEEQKEKTKNIIIAIPCLREQNYIKNTIEYFTKITKNIPIVIITTQKEIKENKNNEKTTQEIIKDEILPKYKNVYLVNYPKENGYMAHQLNYMLENINQIFNHEIDFENTYLALYNADSKPNKNTFEEIKEKIQKGYLVIQQYSYCMQNYNKLNNILRGFALYQSNFEIKTGLINSFLKSKILYTHIVGHGLIINMKTLKDLGNFNTKFWCEDIYLGLQLKFNNINITPLLSLENIETPNSIGNLIKQNSVWFKTTSQFLKIYKDILKNNKIKNKVQGIIGVFNEFRCACNWLIFPIILLIGFIGTIIIKNYKLLFILSSSYFIYIFVNTLLTIKIINKLDNKNYKINFITIINLFIATLISNIGPIYSIVVNKKEKHKTER